MNPVHFPSFVAVSGTPAISPLGRTQKAAREFESQLIGSMLQSLEKTFAHVPGEAAPTGEDEDYNYISVQALASTLAARGGFGIAKMIQSHLGSTKVGA